MFPESWYPDSTPPNLEKWKVPSCIRCNSELGTIEDEFLQLVSVCLDPNNPASKSIIEKAQRARDPESTEDETEKKHRKAARDWLYSQLIIGEAIPDRGIYPTLNNKWNTPKQEQVAVKLPKGHFIKITEKIVRGIFLLEDKKFIEPPYSVEFFALGEAGTQPIRELLARNGKLYAREPGIKVKRALADDGMSSVFEIDFWEQFQTHAVVTRGPLSNTAMAKKSTFTEAVEYLAGVASIAAILGVLYFTWPIREAPELTKEIKTPIAKLNLKEMKMYYDRSVSQPRFYKRHDKADKFLKRWAANESILFPLSEMDAAEFRREGVSPDKIDWQGGMLDEANRRMTAPESVMPKFDSMLDMTFRIPFEEHKNVGYISGRDELAALSSEFSNKQMAAFVDAYSRSRRIFTPVVLDNRSGADALNVKVIVNSAQYPGAEMIGIGSENGIGKLAALPAGTSTWFFIRTTNAPVKSEHIVVHQEGERIRGSLLVWILGISAIGLLIWRTYARA